MFHTFAFTVFIQEPPALLFKYRRPTGIFGGEARKLFLLTLKTTTGKQEKPQLSLNLQPG